MNFQRKDAKNAEIAKKISLNNPEKIFASSRDA